jgi:hypothetical protein
MPVDVMPFGMTSTWLDKHHGDPPHNGRDRAQPPLTTQIPNDRLFISLHY